MLFRVKVSLALLLLLLAGHHHTSRAQVAKLQPVDDAQRDPSFFLFRARLLKATQARDAAFILGVLSPDIKNSFGGSGGVPEFKQTWKPERPDSKLWGTLTSVLALGGAFQGADRFIAPYTYSNFPEKYDAFEHGVIVGENVRVRQRPAADSPVTATLSFDIVKVSDWKPKQEAKGKQAWVVVSLASGAQGYVAEDYIRSPIDYRAIFEKKGGRWLLIALVSGD